ncbi:hypothetical protein [Nannocystis punicea]|uniref:Uncharacterized protein n=1 Tax=Nannocystis punicea TaxID=2995304 RepID=A0ABY7GZ43_9BACT|nr:hypothetical protein [Nannocystis poenicansa]WAS92150.1 hypothetical protein O0S08_38705 [Nannocystis poenicansa]
MQHHDSHETSLGRRLLRAAVVMSSTGLAAVLILRAGGVTGCDGHASPPPQPASQVQQPAAEATKKTPEAEPAASQAQAASAPNPAPQPAAANPGNAANNVEPRTLEVGKNYFPASKAGPAIHPEPLVEPAREPAVQQQAPQPQQAAPQ